MTPRLAHETSVLVLPMLFVVWQAALQLSKEQGLALAALTRTMIGQLSALSQRFKALDDVEERSSPADSPLQNGEGLPRRPAVASSPDVVHGPALRRCSPELAALRVSAASGPWIRRHSRPLNEGTLQLEDHPCSAIPSTRLDCDRIWSSRHQASRVMPYWDPDLTISTRVAQGLRVGA